MVQHGSVRSECLPGAAKHERAAVSAADQRSPAAGTNTWFGNIQKDIPIRERVKLQLRFECMNLFNRNIVGVAQTNPTASTFGVVSTDQGAFARWIQVPGRLTF